MNQSLYIVFQAGVTPQSAGQLQSVLANAINNKFAEVTILISSPGGNVFSGLAVASLIKASPIPITVHNIGQIDSIAGVIYAAGTKRLSQRNSSFLFHGVKLTFPSSVELTEQQLSENLSTLKRDRENIARNISDYSGVEYSKIDELMKQAEIISAETGMEIGLVHEIVEAKIPTGVQIVTIA